MRHKRLIISLPLITGIALFLSWGELVWFATQLTDTPEAYASYAENHPKSEHVELALSCLDELEWRLTESYEGVLGYAYYLDRLPNGPHSKEARAGLRAARLNDALAKGDLAAIDEHLELYPADNQEARVQALLENLEWRRLLSRDSSELFKQFLEQFPSGAHALEAAERLSRINFRMASQEGSIAAWQSYIESAPPAEFLERARLRLNESSWEAVQEAPSIEKVRGFLELLPAERFEDEARQVLEELAWAEAQEVGTREAIELYLNEFPMGLYGFTAQLQLEGIAWNTALEVGTRDALQSYLAEYPDGSHVAEIPSVEEQLLWGRAQSLDELKAYRAYLNRFPDGPNAVRAKLALMGRSVLQMQALGQLNLSIFKARPAVLELELAFAEDYNASIVDPSVTVGFPVGLLFSSASSELADLVVLRSSQVRLRLGERQRVLLNVGMLNGITVAMPDQYSAPLVMDETSAAFLKAALERGASNNVIQLALLISADDLGFEALSKLRGPSGKLMSVLAIAEAMQLCRELGVEITKRRIWSERAQVRPVVPEGELREWLSQPESVGDAIRFGNLEQLGAIIEAGANPNQTGDSQKGRGHSLALALELNRLDLGQKLLSSGARLGSASEAQELLSQAVQSERAGWVRMLLEAGAKADILGSSPSELSRAATLGNIQIMDILLEAGAALNGLSEYEVPLNRAAEAGQLASVRHLIGLQANLDLGMDTALMLAAEKGHLKVLQLLIESGADVDRPGKWGYTALHKSVEQGRLASVELLIRSGADVNRDAGGFRPIDLAALHSKQLVEYLLTKKASETIFSCVALGDLDGIERCLAKGESIDRWGTGATRPLHVAIRMRQGEAVERLLSHGADVHARSTEGLQALHGAVRMGWPEAIRTLVEHGADLNDAGIAGTPLQLAVGSGDFNTTKLLLDMGADPSLKRAQDKSALELAQAAAQADPKTFGPIIKLLQRALGA